jgi:hypothetical protein
MIGRCTLSSIPAHDHYKARGITVCERWREFRNFLADMGERPGGRREYTLERIDNTKGYEPGNCRWATWREQANNRSTNIHFEYEGQRFTLAELSRHTGVKKELLRSRLCRSPYPWTVEGAVKTPMLPHVERRSGFYA